MARRAALFSALRAGGKGPVLFLAGPGEFHDQEGPPANSTDKAFESRKSLTTFASILFGLDYDLGVLAPREADSLAQRQVAWPASFTPARELTSRVLTLADGRAVGVLVLPPLAPGQEGPPPALTTAMGAMSRELRGQCGLVVAMSPWGYLAENAYLTRDAAPAMDVLLGAGPGPGTAQSAAGGRVLWVRSYTRGKTVQTLALRAWPGTRRDFAWGKEDFVFDNQALDDSRPSDPEVNARLTGINQ